MTVVNVHKDLDACTLAITSEYDASVERVWQLWADPRQLERWWGPPMFPATFVEHSLTVGSIVTYYMTSPDGERFHGWWRIVAAEPPHRLEFEDGFADPEGRPAPDLPTTLATMTITPRAGGGSTMTIRSTFTDRAGMEQVLAMGLEEGLTAALGQTDALLDPGAVAAPPTG